MTLRETVLAAAISGIAVTGAAAQSWEAPTYFAPRLHDDIGLYLVDTEGSGGAGIASIWRQSGNLNLGVRGGVAPGPFDWMLGVEMYGPLDLGLTSPVALAWIVGAGGLFGGDSRGSDVTAVRIPAGVSVGLNLEAGGATIVPYVHPRAAFDLRIFSTDGEEETDSEVNVDVDLGADVLLGGRFIVRGGVTLGDFTTFGAGVAYRIPRGIAVR
ncbi:MAG: hypothetical protein ACREM1_23040 [Longimicrobiales bacterium]